MSMMTESHLQLVQRLGRNSGGEDVMQPFERVVIAFEPANTFFHGEAGLHRFIHRTNSSQWRDFWESSGSIHGSAVDNVAPIEVWLQASATACSGILGSPLRIIALRGKLPVAEKGRRGESVPCECLFGGRSIRSGFRT